MDVSKQDLSCLELSPVTYERLRRAGYNTISEVEEALRSNRPIEGVNKKE